MIRRKKSRSFFWVILLMAGLIIYVWEQVESGRLKHRLENLKNEKKELMNTKVQMQIKANQLCSSERLSKVAKEWNFNVPSVKQIKEISVNENNNK